MMRPSMDKMMRSFHTKEDRARAMVEQGIAVDFATAMMIGEPKEENKDASGTVRTNDINGRQGRTGD